jgi:predicted DNA-binding transcriptional regulator AlpA
MADDANLIVQHKQQLELEKEFYTLRETCELISCSRPMIYKWIADDEFQPYRKGNTRNRIIPAAQIIDFLERHNKKKNPDGHYCAFEMDDDTRCTQRIRIEAEFCWMHGNEIAEAGVLESLTESTPDFYYPNLPDVAEDDDEGEPDHG